MQQQTPVIGSRQRLGAHTFLFTQYGSDPAQELDAVFDTVAAAGFQAIELHQAMLSPPDWEARITGALRRTGLALVGASHGQPLWDITRYEAIRAELDAYSDKLARFGPVQCGCSCSGKRLAQRTAAENAQVVRVWTELAGLFQRKGVTLTYHTHGEPLDDIHYVTEHVPATLLPLGPDLDWLRVGGIDPVAFLREQAGRLSMLHLRDYHMGGARTEALGEGDVDYAQLQQVLTEIGFSGDVVVELAAPPGAPPSRPAAELLTRSRAHLQRTMGL